MLCAFFRNTNIDIIWKKKKKSVIILMEIWMELWKSSVAKSQASDACAIVSGTWDKCVGKGGRVLNDLRVKRITNFETIILAPATICFPFYYFLLQIWYFEVFSFIQLQSHLLQNINFATFLLCPSFKLKSQMLFDFEILFLFPNIKVLFFVCVKEVTYILI